MLDELLTTYSLKVQAVSPCLASITEGKINHINSSPLPPHYIGQHSFSPQHSFIQI